MSDSWSVDRRTFLRTVGVSAGGLAPAETAENKASVVAETTATTEAAESSESWPQFGYDAANTGYAPENTGPGGRIQEKWSVQLLGSVENSPVVSDGTVYINDDHYQIQALDSEDGSQQWSSTTHWSMESTPAVNDDTVYLGGGHHLYALDREDGSQQWAFDTGDTVWSSTIIASGTIFVRNSDSQLYALDAEDGTQKWAFDTGGIRSDSSPAVDKGTVYIGSPNGNVYALDAEDGTEEWIYDAKYAVNSPAVADGTVYIGEQGYTAVHALDAATGQQKWVFETTDSVNTSPSVADGSIYVGAHNILYALNAEDGTKQWSFETASGWSFFRPVVVNSTVYVGSTLGYVHALNAENGTEQWSFKTEGKILSSPAVVDGTVYVGDSFGRVYALSTPLEAKISDIKQPLVTGVPVSFDASHSTPSEDIRSYEWTIAGKEYSGKTVEHTFADNGEYKVELNVTNDDSATDTTTQTITVENQPPTADINVTPSTPVTDQRITLSAKESSDPDGRIVSYEWTIAEREFSGETVDRIFNVIGEYTVELTVTDDDGATDTTTQTVRVSNQDPTASFTWSPSSPVAGELVTFDGTSSSDPNGTISNYEWSIDGTTKTGVLATHTFDDSGGYTVELTVTDDDGATARETLVVEVGPEPTTPTSESSSPLTETHATSPGPTAPDSNAPSGTTNDSTVPWLPLGAGTLAGLTGLTAWYRFGDSDDTESDSLASDQSPQQSDEDTPEGDSDKEPQAKGDTEETDDTSETPEVTEPPARRFAQACPAVESVAAVSETDSVHVYRGTIVDGPDDACLYTMAPEHAESEVVVSAFTNAVSRWRGISQNEGIATAYESGERPRPWVAFDDSGELLSGAGGDLTLPEKRRVLLSVFEALKVGSLYSVTHPGLSPETVTIAGSDQDIQTTIFDWGLTRDVEAALGEPPVTPYTAPEQLTGDQAATTDVYRAGALAYWLLTGVEPHAGADNLQRAIRTETLDAPSDVAAVPAELDDILATATAIDPQERYDSVSDLRNELRRVLE